MSGTGLSGLVLGLVVFQAVDRPSPAELVARLGAPKYAEREAAGEALVKIGRAALPALAKVRDSRDLELRQRAEVVAARIEAAEVLDASRVRLDVRNRPLAEAVEAIARGTDQTLRPGVVVAKPGVEPAWPDARVTLETAEPVPFWEAVDRLCAAGGLQRLYPPAANHPFPFRAPFELTLVPGHARPPASDTGSLRVELLRIRYHRQRDYADNEFGPSPAGKAREPKTGAVDRAFYTAELLVSAEPRVRIIGVGAVEDAEAVDDRGRSLLKVPMAEEQAAQQNHLRANAHLDPVVHPALRYGSRWHPATRAWPVTVPLSYPSPRAQRIARLRGVIPLVAVARRRDPLVVDLKDAAGKAFSAGTTRIAVHEIKAESGREPTIDFTLETGRAGEGQTIEVYAAQGDRLAVDRPVDLMELRLEVVDGRGESLFWQYARSPSEQTQGRMTIVVHDRNGKRERPEALRLRYWGLVGAAIDLPFSFDDVPTP